jgi:hypothetical protein
MNTSETSEVNELSEELKDLAVLHPTYSLLELEQARAQLHRYFDLAWQIFVRLEHEGKLGALNLTNQPVNLKVNARKPTTINLPSEPP